MLLHIVDVCLNVICFQEKKKAASGIMDQRDPELTAEDVKVYLVDPRDQKPCLRELSDIYKEHVELQKGAVKRVSVIEKEMDALLESRMKELSANDMEVWVFDTKRNSHVQKGRLEQEQQQRRKEESILDLELDFLAPYFQRYMWPYSDILKLIICAIPT